MFDRAFDLAADTRPGLGLEARALCFAADGRRLIDGLDLALSPRGATVVLGPNGAGKSLLLRILHGLLSPSAGAVLQDGRPLDAAARRRQALVFQRPVLLRRTVAANVSFALKLRGGAARDRCEALLGHVGLADKARQSARTLSGGEQQRLAVARALATDPEILLMDEPTANLDPASAQVIEQLTLEARDRGVKIVFVTHDVAQARRLADDVVFLDQGRVIEHAAAETALHQPQTAAARAYLRGDLVL